MSLVEKRMVEKLEKDYFPAWKKTITEACGTELAFDVRWDELVKEKFIDSYPETVNWNFFAPLERTLKQICTDEIGKSAFRALIKKVRIRSLRPSSSLEVTIDVDTLVLDADPSYNRTKNDAYVDYSKRMSAVLEARL